MGYNASTRRWREVADKNPRAFVERKLSIVDDMGTVVPFKYRLFQREYSDRKQLILRANKPLRLAFLKWRRAGNSSVETAESYAQCYGRDHARIAIIAHLESRAGELLQNYRGFNDSLNTHHPELKQEMSRDNLFGIKFEESKSQVLIASSENPIKVRGDGVHIIHGSEFAHWLADYTKVLREICPVVPSKPQSQIVFESTGSVVGSAPYNHYYEMTPWDEFIKNGFERSRGKNEFVRHFACWRDDPDCSSTFTPGREMVEFGELVEMIRATVPRLAERCAYYKLSPGQWLWAWEQFSYKGTNNYSYFCREFPFCESDAWSAGSDSYFGNHEIEIAMSNCPNPTWVYVFDDASLMRVFDSFAELNEVSLDRPDDIDGYPVNPILKVWAPPVPGERYVLGSDSSQGGYDGDYSYGCMINMKTREMMATYHGLMKPAEAAHLNVSLCRIYNRALAAPETNPCGGGSEVLNVMQRLGYHNYYTFKKYDHKDGIVNTNSLGWWTGPRTRDKMLVNLNQLFSDCVHNRIALQGLFRDKGLLREMRTFAVNPRTGRLEALPGCFDDRVFGCGIAHQAACDEMFGTRFDIIRQEYHTFKPEPRKAIDPKEQAKLVSKVMTPDKVMQQFSNPSSAFNRNKGDWTINMPQ